MFEQHDFTLNDNVNQNDHRDIYRWMRRFAKEVRGYVLHGTKLYDFLNNVLQTRHYNRTTAMKLLESDKYTAEEFAILKSVFCDKVNHFRMDSRSTLQCIPDRFKSDHILPSLPDKRTSSDKDGYIDCSEYLSKITNGTLKFEDGSRINVSFAFKCALYPPLKATGSFVVGSESTMFELLMGLLDLKIYSEPRNEQTIDKWKIANLMRKYIKAENVDFTLDPLYPVRAWDIIRLRTALQSMLSDIAMSGDGRYLVREFILCKLEGEVLRKVTIEIKCDGSN